MQKISMWNTPCHLWLGSQDITVAASHHLSSCWPLMVSGLPAGITSLPVLALQEGTTPSPASIWLLIFLLGFACTEQELPQSSLLLISYCPAQVGSWWFAAETFQDYKKLPGVGHQLPLGRKSNPFLGLLGTGSQGNPARCIWALSLSPLTKLLSLTFT